jgi:hypothetical protein
VKVYVLTSEGVYL